MELLLPAAPRDVAAVGDDWRGCSPGRSNAWRTTCRRRGEPAHDLKARLLLLGETQLMRTLRVADLVAESRVKAA
uniref:Uncharacterized protein n=1 Tax=Vitis vinifera TaxID=29760 RepID=A5BSJ9_VITVI|nr:hypothetical protein VITISV_034373 [Vitis vinifera]